MLGIAEDNCEAGADPSVPDTQSSQSPTKGSPLKTAKPVTINTESEDEDDEPVIRTKIQKKKRPQILEDSDSDADEPNDKSAPNSERNSDSERDSKVTKAFNSSDNDSDDGIPEERPASLKKKKIVINSDSDSESEIESVEKKKPTRFNLDSGPESETEDVKSPKKAASGSSSSSEDEEGPKEALAWGSDSSDDDPGELSEALKKKLAKGASKTNNGSARKGQSRKSKTDAMTEIHAETQRLVRESEIRLPYHKPAPLGLSAILEKTKKKQESLKDLRRAWKTPPVVQTCSTTTPSFQKTRAVGESRGASPNLTKPIVIEDPKPVEDPKNTPAPMDLEAGDELPDITATPLSERLQAKNISTEAIKSTEVVQSLEDKLKAAEKKPEQDSGFISTSCHTSEEENSSDQPNKNIGDQEQGNKNEASPLRKEPEVKNIDLLEKTPVAENKVPARRSSALTPRLASLGVSDQKPKLSGGPNSYIDLDDEGDNTPKPGVLDLMDRLMKHSAHRKKKGAQDVELSTIQKVTTEGDREELQVKKFVVHLDGEEDQLDKSTTKPGAKLSSLKQTLAEKMKLKREEARKQRCEIYALDNEEGFDDEEEAELTDQSDTDGEEVDEEEEMEEEEEMDENEYTSAEKERMSNPFLNDEAEDDDEEQEEGDLHLEFNEEEETETADEPQRKPAKAFLKAALQKTNTLQLFDDDAISESPTLSQSTNKENIEVSDRPFEQLSGETVKLSQKNMEDDFDDDIDTDVNNDAEDDVAMLNPDDDDDDNTSLRLENPNLSYLRDKDGSVGTDADSSYDTLIPPGQGTAKKNRYKDCRTPDLFTPSSKSSMATNSTYCKSTRAMNDLPMPIEDSQDLLGSPLRNSQAESTPRDQPMTSFNFNLDDSETCSKMLDEDGLLKEKSSTKKAARRQLMLEEESGGEDDVELLGLCSGKFSLSQGTQDKPQTSFADIGGIDRLMDDTQSMSDDILGLCSGQFSSTHKPVTQAQVTKELELHGTQATQGNMSELLGLCSGQFSGDKSQSPKKIVKKKRRRVITDDEDDDEFEVSDTREAGPGMEEVNLDSDEEPDREPESDSSEDEELVLAKKIKKIKKKKQKMDLKNFVDAEAELSGSEYDSDENFDIDEKDDILERCSGDEDEFDDDQLQEQVGRVHLKNMIDEDKRDIRLMQEMYLPDGDLYNEGGGRMRRFRWKNIDEDSQQDMFPASDEETEEDNLEAQKWRLERHEREKFLSQQKEAEETGEKEPEPQKIKLGKVVFKPKRDPRKVLEACNQMNPKEGTTSSLFKVPKSSHGSFLSRGRDTLAKIAEFTKPVSATVGGPKNSKGFVFSSLSEEDKGGEGVAKKPAVRRSMSSPATNQPASKKPRLEKSATLPIRKKSIFNHL